MTPQRLLSQDILGAQTRHGGEPRQGRKRTGVWIAGLTTCALVAALAGLLGTRMLRLASQPLTAADASSRAAYLGADGRLHTVSLSGDDVARPVVQQPGYLTAALPLNNASLSPDGRLLAYSAGSGPDSGSFGGAVSIMNVATGSVTQSAASASELYWSPDGSQLAAQGALDDNFIFLIDARSGQTTQVPLSYEGRGADLGRIVGWVGANHLAALVHPTATGSIAALRSFSPAGSARATVANTPLSKTGPEGTVLFLGVIDIQTGLVRRVSTVGSPPDVFLTPDGSEALVASNFWNNSAVRVNLATGQVTPLPGITSAFAGAFVNMDNFNYAHGGNYSTHIAWKPGTHALAVSLVAKGIGTEGTVGPATQPAGVWLLDLDHDTATQVTHDTYPLAWTPDGRALLLCDPAKPSSDGIYPSGGGGVGPTLSVLAPASAGSKPVTLSTQMVTFFGLITKG